MLFEERRLYPVQKGRSELTAGWRQILSSLDILLRKFMLLIVYLIDIHMLLSSLSLRLLFHHIPCQKIRMLVFWLSFVFFPLCLGWTLTVQAFVNYMCIIASKPVDSKVLLALADKCIQFLVILLSILLWRFFFQIRMFGHMFGIRLSIHTDDNVLIMDVQHPGPYFFFGLAVALQN